MRSCQDRVSGVSRLCSNGARSPQATNIWSRANRNKTSERIETERNETKRNFLALPLASPKNKSAESASIACVIFISRTLRLNIKVGHGSLFASVVSLPVF